jgi:hypothetical protein
MTWRIFWALVLILVGVLFLLINLGILPPDSWNYVLPALFILGGIGLLIGWRGSRADTPTVQASEPLNGAARGELTLKHGAGRLALTAGTDTNLVFSGTFVGGVEKKTSRAGDTVIIELRTPGAYSASDNFPFARRLDWDISLNPTLPLALKYEGGAANTRLDLSGVPLTNLDVSTGASSTDIILPMPRETMNVRFNSGAASVILRLPPTAPASIRGKMDLGSLNLDTHRFVSQGTDLYQTSDYVNATDRIDILIQGGVGSVEIR